MRPALNFALVLTAGLVAACSHRPAVPISGTAEDFKIECDLAGKSVGRGQFRTITGTRRAFTVRLGGRWDGKTFTLIEDFEFDDGETDRKTWQLTKQADGGYIGTREDVVETAVAFMDGPALRLEYTVDLERSGGQRTRVRFRDVLIRRTDGTIYNKATISKWGFHIGRVELTITPEG